MWRIETLLPTNRANRFVELAQDAAEQTRGHPRGRQEVQILVGELVRDEGLNEPLARAAVAED
jgi:hypothetical protein